MPSLLSPLAAIFAVQLAATAGAWLLRSQERALKRHLPLILSLAVGVLLATSLLHLMPDAVRQLGNGPLVWSLFGGAMLVLFAVERFFFVLTGTVAEPEVTVASPSHLHHHHSTRPMNLILAGMLHSLVDGTAVAAAFLTGSRVGWLTALAVALHEIPHRMGDFAVLVHLGVPLPRALRLAAVAGVPSLLGPLLVLTADHRSSPWLASLLPVSAGSFLYIATVNLLPELQAECKLFRVLLQLACLAAGVSLVVLVGDAG